MDGTQIEPWLNVGAVSACIGLVIYMITKGGPQIIERFIEETSKLRDDFKSESAEQRTVFRDEMRAQREMTTILVNEGHSALKGVAKSVDDLRDEIHVHFEELRHNADVVTRNTGAVDRNTERRGQG